MSILDVVIWPAKVLETKSEEVTKFDDELKKFVNDMHETMKYSAGIGLAANQVGDLRRVVTIEIPYASRDGEIPDPAEKQEWWHDKKFTFINPVITKKAGKFKYQEGCLSFPEIFEFVDRAEEVWVKALDEQGQPFEAHANGLFAVCLQHEIDHIDGIVFLKRMSRLKSGLAVKKMMRQAVPADLEKAKT